MIAALVRWFREESRLLAAQSWEREDMRVDVPAYLPCSSEDPRCAETIRRLAECRQRMARTKAGLLDGRTFTNSASTDVAATIRKVRSLGVGPVRIVGQRRIGR